MDKYSGKRLDARYEIQELIGVGGMAYVYKAYDIIDDRTVAIKILKEEFLGNQDFMRRFKNESKAIAMLDHPNIVKVFSVSFGDRMQYIVMEYIDGISLKEYIDRQTEVSWKEAIHFTTQILKALHHAHDNGIIHRDIKPQNIMLLQDGSIKVTDFGIARFSDSETRTMTDKAIGSVHYIAPEQARGELTDGKTDIYSVGVMLYEMITGQLPFEADNAVSVAIMQLQTDPKPPREINPAIPVGLEEITLKAMQKNPQQRYQSAREMLVDLDAFRRDPNVRFHYMYTSAAEEATRVVDGLDNVVVQESDSFYQTPVRQTSVQRTSPAPEAPRYGDNYAYDGEDYDDAQPKKKTGLIVGISVGAAAAIAAIALILCFVFGVFGGGDSNVVEIDLPNFVGQKLEDVQAKQKNSEYKNLKLDVTYTEDSDKEAGIIIKQNPDGKIKVKENATVTLTVSSGSDTKPVPDVKGKSQTDAVAELVAAGFQYKIEEIADDSVESGKVIKTSPESGTKAPKDSTVIVYVSSGAKKVSVPPVNGETLDVAKSRIQSAGLQVGNVTYENNNEVAEGRVISTNPGSGSEVDKDSTVSIVVSKGSAVSNVDVQVNLPSGVSSAMSMETYVDGVLYDTKTVRSSQRQISVNLEGEGTKSVKVYLDDQLYAEYSVNFSNGTVKQTGSYQYNQGGNGDNSYSGYTDPSITSSDYKGVTN